MIDSLLCGIDSKPRACYHIHRLPQKGNYMQEKKKKKNSDGIKRLLDWMKTNNITINKVAVGLGVHYQLVWEWLHGNRTPSLEKAVKLQHLTERKVSCQDWISESPKKPTKGKANANK